ncbi:MAG: amidohydrolase family protein [Candidatus Hermodarchaeota archaeon]
MEKIIIKNGHVYDPLNNIGGEIKDILIENGKVVDKFSNESNVKEINAKNKTVIPSALDIHTHIASHQLNFVRLLGSKNHLFQDYWKGLTLNHIAQSYIKNGYTFILEANVFPSLAKTSIFDFQQLPVLDKAMLLNISNLWQLELEFQNGKIKDMATFIQDLLRKVKAFGLKAYNPFENEAEWNFFLLREDLTSKGRLYNFSALDVYENLTKCVNYLGLPHSVHAHIEGYETEQAKTNLSIVLDKINSLNIEKNSKLKRSQLFHLAHGSHYNIDGENTELLKIINNSDRFDLDLGIITFNPINPFISSDKHLMKKLRNEETDHKIIRYAAEFEGDNYSTLRSFKTSNPVHCKIWANAIELALNIKDKWKIQLTVNYPNYGDINDIPLVATWLMSTEARTKYIKDMAPEFSSKEFLIQNDQVLSFNDFIIISRSSPAKSLGLSAIKGGLGIGTDGDVNILNIDLNEIDTNKDYEKVRNSLTNIEFVIKNGIVVKSDDKIDLNSHGKIFWSEGTTEIKDASFILNKKKEFYQKYYSIFYKTLETSIPNELLRKV